MPAQFFTATDDKPTGTSSAYQRLMTFMRRNDLQWSPAIASLANPKVDVRAAVDEMWDGISAQIAGMRANVSGPLNVEASDLEVALIAYFCLREKFQQYGATLPGGGGP